MKLFLNLSGRLELVQGEHIVFSVTVLDVREVPPASLQVRAYVRWQVEHKNQAQTCLLSPSLLLHSFMLLMPEPTAPSQSPPFFKAASKSCPFHPIPRRRSTRFSVCNFCLFQTLLDDTFPKEGPRGDMHGQPPFPSASVCTHSEWSRFNVIPCGFECRVILITAYQ